MAVKYHPSGTRLRSWAGPGRPTSRPTGRVTRRGADDRWQNRTAWSNCEPELEL